MCCSCFCLQMICESLMSIGVHVRMYTTWSEKVYTVCLLTVPANIDQREREIENNYTIRLIDRGIIFSARSNIYISRAYAMMPVSVCLSVCLWRLCIVVTGCDGSRISLHAWIDGCLCYLLTTPHPDRRMGWCRDIWWMRGRVWNNWLL